MKKITIFDTSILTENMGDFIIMDAVNRELNKIFEGDMIFYSLTHDEISKGTYKLNEISEYSFIGGTNLLSSNMNRYNQWKINLYDSIHLKNIILMGVGWWQYQGKPNLYTRYLLKSVLNNTVLHSVRDSYTEKMLHSIGIKNVVNTGCMTMWNLTKEHCSRIPKIKSENVVFTLTDYNKDIENDRKLIDILGRNYNNIYFWPQGSGDLEYIQSLDGAEYVIIIGGNLSSYDRLLNDNSMAIDFVGTRLHAGIRALQSMRRSIIIGIDNRAEEKSKDFNLNVLPRDQMGRLAKIINSEFVTDIKLNVKKINIWKSQFR